MPRGCLLHLQRDVCVGSKQNTLNVVWHAQAAQKAVTEAKEASGVDRIRYANQI